MQEPEHSSNNRNNPYAPSPSDSEHCFRDHVQRPSLFSTIFYKLAVVYFVLVFAWPLIWMPSSSVVDDVVARGRIKPNDGRPLANEQVEVLYKAFSDEGLPMREPTAPIAWLSIREELEDERSATEITAIVEVTYESTPRNLSAPEANH